MGNRIIDIIAPLSGTFYRAPAPDEDPFVEVGQKVQPGDVVCIVESMKVFTEVRTEHEGVVKEILVENEEPVRKDQVLVRIEVTDQQEDR